MRIRTFHLLTESEPFSDVTGGAISRWVANATRPDADAIVLAPSADASWNWDPARIRVIDGLNRYKQVCRYGGHRAPWVLRISMLATMLRRALCDLQPGDTVWVHNRPEFALALQPMVARRGGRLVLHLHNSHLVEWPEHLIRALQVDMYVFVSQYLRTEALQKFPGLSETSVMHNGADGERFHPGLPGREKNGVPVMLFAGRLVPEKGVHLLFDAMDRLTARNVPALARVVGGAAFGESAPTEYVRRLRERKPANVEMLSYRSGDRLAEEFRNADVFCLPSCWQEPLGMAPIEAMASGLPIVISDGGGLPELLKAGGGLLVARSSSSDLAEALERLALNPELRRDLGREALSSFQRNFTWSTVHERYLDILSYHSKVLAHPTGVFERMRHEQ